MHARSATHSIGRSAHHGRSCLRLSWRARKAASPGGRGDQYRTRTQYAIYFGDFAPLMRGVSLLRSGQFEQALPDMISGLKLWDGSGAGIWSPYTKSLMAKHTRDWVSLGTALEIVNTMLAQISRPSWEERCHLQRCCASRAGCSRSRVTLTVPNGTFTPRSTGRGASRRNPGSCAPRPASPACGKAKANAKTRMSCSPRFTPGSPKASTPRICWRRRLCWKSWHERPETRCSVQSQQLDRPRR